MGTMGYKVARDSIRYGFAVGKVRVLETRIFGRATLERLLDAPTFEEQRRILSDTVYGRYFEGVQTADGVERALSAALDDFYRFLDEASLPESVTYFFRVRHDFANFKAALKARLLGVSAEGMFVDVGSIPVEAYLRPLDELPAPFGPLAEELLERLDAESGARAASPTPDGLTAASKPAPVEPDLAAADAAVDRAMFAELAGAAKRSRSGFLAALVSLEVDIANVRTLVRARVAGASAADVAALALEGGSIHPAQLADLYALPPLEAGLRLASLPALRGISATDLADMGRLDVLADNVIVAYLRKARMVAVGPEPVIAYVMGREAEVVAVRTLLIGRLSGLSTDVLRRRMRDLYV